MPVYIRYKKKNVNEDDVNTAQQGSTAQQGAADANNQSDAKIKSLSDQIIARQEQKRAAQTEYENRVRILDQQVNQLKKQIVDLGGDIVKMESARESARGFGRRLYESVINKTDEMFAMISMIFDEADGISYRPDSTRCRTFAKNIIGYLNRNDFDKPDAEEKFSDFLMNLLNRSQVSFSNGEKERFIRSLLQKMKESALFSWIEK